MIENILKELWSIVCRGDKDSEKYFSPPKLLTVAGKAMNAQKIDGGSFNKEAGKSERRSTLTLHRELEEGPQLDVWTKF